MKRTLALIYRLILLLGCGYGLYANLFGSGSFNPRMLTYYTIQSNLICFVFFLMLVLMQLAQKRRVLEGRACATVKCACTMCILVTGLVFHFVLSSEPSFTDFGITFWAPGNFFAHTFTPLFVMLDYFLFDAKGRVRFTDPLIWMSIPYAYLVFVYIYRALGGRFPSAGNVPYFFLNAQKYGAGGVALWILGITAVMLVLWTLFVLLDRALGHAAKSRQTHLDALSSNAPMP